MQIEKPIEIGCLLEMFMMCFKWQRSTYYTMNLMNISSSRMKISMPVTLFS